MNKSAIPLEVRRHKLVASVRNQLKDNVLVGVSGGADSTALLLLCCAVSLQQSSTLNVIAGHINHGIRSESDAEQQMVETLCEKLGVKCVSKKITVTPIDGSLAAGARKGRYNELASIATNNNLTQIAVAHHATDQLETMLMALCRGGGPRKLAGMAAARQLTTNIALIRPLLHSDPAVLEDICSLSDVTWCNDPTNCDTTTPRGKLRIEVLPKLRELWPAADRHASNASVMLQAAADTLDAQARLLGEPDTWSRKELSNIPQDIVATLMHKSVGNQTPFETVRTIAAAITDTSTEPRAFDCGSQCIVHVTA
ncbi:MAG TPA: tRNA lysidine(34) synthetase TilS, partial [Phycisphaerales bacterium]|nr:tRNA lysidine(34) synthetase TilS [Phycisphaerales bacterium]